MLQHSEAWVVMKVVILAGGLGSRLAEEPQVRPKPDNEVFYYMGAAFVPIPWPMPPRLISARDAAYGDFSAGDSGVGI